MNTSKRLVARLVVCFFLMAGFGVMPAQAFDTYMFMRGGNKKLVDFYHGYSGRNYRDYQFSGGYGAREKNLRFEVEVSYSSYNHIDHDTLVRSTIDVTTFGNFYYSFPLHPYFVPYVGLGVGSVTLWNKPRSYENYGDSVKFGFAGQAIAGFLIPLGNRIAITADGRYGGGYHSFELNGGSANNYLDKTSTFQSFNIGLQYNFNIPSWVGSVAKGAGVAAAAAGAGYGAYKAAEAGVLDDMVEQLPPSLRGYMPSTSDSSGTGGGSPSITCQSYQGYGSPGSQLYYLEQGYCCTVAAVVQARKHKRAEAETKSANSQMKVALEQNVPLMTCGTECPYRSVQEVISRVEGSSQCR